MNYKEVWNVLSELLAEIRKNNIDIPDNIIKDFRSAKTMMEILDLDPTNYENLVRMEEFLVNVESFIMSKVEENLGGETASQWASKILNAQNIPQKRKKLRENRFPFVSPKDQRWIIVDPSYGISLKEIKKVSTSLGLKYKIQENGHIQIIGDESRIKQFIKETARALHDKKIV